MKVKSKPNHPIRIRTQTIGVRVHGVTTTPLMENVRMEVVKIHVYGDLKFVIPIYLVF